MTDQQLSSSQRPAAGTGDGATMIGIAQNRYGPAPEDVLRQAELAVPAVADDQVLVRVHAASVDRGTWHVMAGTLTAVIDRTHPLEEVPAAIRYLLDGHTRGKIVILVHDADPT
jgi:NADPH:quinone reductase-like Zn-dependent oxidoreductase